MVTQYRNGTIKTVNGDEEEYAYDINNSITYDNDDIVNRKIDG